jgi:hypothetical protein
MREGRRKNKSKKSNKTAEMESSVFWENILLFSLLLLLNNIYI